jgi:hypothetical protein
MAELSRRRTGTDQFMLQGIVSRRGIEVLCPEHPQAARWLWQLPQTFVTAAPGRGIDHDFGASV